MTSDPFVGLPGGGTLTPAETIRQGRTDEAAARAEAAVQAGKALEALARGWSPEVWDYVQRDRVTAAHEVRLATGEQGTPAERWEWALVDLAEAAHAAATTAQEALR